MEIDKIQHKTFADNRGSFTAFDLKTDDWDQANISINTDRYTFRGMHWQADIPQTKYVKVIQGRVLDIIMDLETEKVQMFELGPDDALLVPNNYAHGFLTLEENTIFSYLVKGAYSPQGERSLPYDQHRVIKEIVETFTTSPTLSDKDRNGK